MRNFNSLQRMFGRGRSMQDIEDEYLVLPPLTRAFLNGSIPADKASFGHGNNPSSNFFFAPTLDFNFLTGQFAAVSGGITPTFTRTGATATRVNANGLIEIVAADTPRFDYDPVTLVSKGLLIEEQQTNLITFSEQFDNAAWLKTAVSITANAATAPDGAATADRLVEDATNALHFAAYNFVPVVADHVVSVFAKAGARSRIEIFKNNSGFNQARGFDLATGLTFANTLGYADPPAYGIQAFGNGWYRCWFKFNVGSAIGSQIGIALNNGAGSTYAGDGASYAVLWGADLKVSNSITSYIPTVAAAAVVRNNDWPKIAVLGSWFNAAEGTIAVEFDHANLTEGVGTYHRVFSLTPSANSPLETWLYTGVDGGAGTEMHFYAKNQQDNRQALLGTTIANVIHKSAVVYKTADNYGGALDGAVPVFDAQILGSTATSLSLGVNEVGGNGLNGHLRRFTYWPARRLNPHLQYLSTP